MKILVLGGGGFIGAWAVEYLFLSGEAEPIIGVRSPSSSVRTGRFGLDQNIRIVDLLNKSSIETALEGIEAVFYCAMLAPDREPEGVKNVVEAMAAKGVRRLIYLSSVAVYGDSGGDLAESAVSVEPASPYAAGKVAGERIVLSAGSVDVTILRPSLVYGPYGKTWTENIARRVLSGAWGTMGAAGSGACNLIYVQDLIEAMVASLKNDNAIGKAYNVNSPERVSWNGYWEHLHFGITGKPIPKVSAGSVGLKAKLLTPVRNIGKYMMANHKGLVTNLYGSNQFIRGIFKKLEGGLKLYPTTQEIDGYSRMVHYSGDAIRDDIGFVPRTGLAEGIGYSTEWLRLLRINHHA